jgi:hypothetical protein
LKYKDLDVESTDLDLLGAYLACLESKNFLESVATSEPSEMSAYNVTLEKLAQIERIITKDCVRCRKMAEELRTTANERKLHPTELTRAITICDKCKKNATEIGTYSSEVSSLRNQAIIISQKLTAMRKNLISESSQNSQKCFRCEKQHMLDVLSELMQITGVLTAGSIQLTYGRVKHLTSCLSVMVSECEAEERTDMVEASKIIRSFCDTLELMFLQHTRKQSMDIISAEQVSRIWRLANDAAKSLKTIL